MKVEVIEPHGFCAGVRGALEKARRLLSETKESVWCLHELVHNELVTAELAAQGMQFAESIEEIPEGAQVLFSAHGVSPRVRARAAAKKLRVTDATCPFVARVHQEAKRHSDLGLPVVIIGRRGHVETDGIAGECKCAYFVGEAEMPPIGVRIGVVAQTTMNADEVAQTVASLRNVYEVDTVADVCNATKERQDSIRAWVQVHKAKGEKVGVLVLGSNHSSNTRRLAEIATEEGAVVQQVGTLGDANDAAFPNCTILGITAGASTPETFLQDILRRYSLGLIPK